MKTILRLIAEIVVLGVTLALLLTPFYLIIKYPRVSDHIEGVSSTFIVAIMALLLTFIFAKNIRETWAQAVKTFQGRRVKKVGNVEFESHQGSEFLGGENKVPENFQGVLAQIGALDEPHLFAWNMYIRYVAATIYKSQYEMLVRLSVGSLKRQEAEEFYARYVELLEEARLNGELDVQTPSFGQWFEYLVRERLVYSQVIDDNPSDIFEVFHITLPGQAFVEEAIQANFSP